MITWSTVDTVLLDMDGTLLDLHYDNTLWTRVLPARYSDVHGVPVADAAKYLFSHMQERRGELSFYCLDYWAEFTGMDIIALHHELAALIRYRPNALVFLNWLHATDKQALLVTNAHRDSLKIKNTHCDVTSMLEATISCHDYGAPKESARFWEQLMEEHPYDPSRTLLIDDNLGVLDAAGAFGIHHLLTVNQPDSQRPARRKLAYPAFNDFREILPDD
ncbi:MAG: GMP/IMP nucleotidase [Gammaproteobacteria bacterium]|nr:GMP/IMP nucleotidase [Gammaproteobacteria bacterium]